MVWSNSKYMKNSKKNTDIGVKEAFKKGTLVVE